MLDFCGLLFQEHIGIIVNRGFLCALVDQWLTRNLMRWDKFNVPFCGGDIFALFPLGQKFSSVGGGGQKPCMKNREGDMESVWPILFVSPPWAIGVDLYWNIPSSQNRFVQVRTTLNAKHERNLAALCTKPDPYTGNLALQICKPHFYSFWAGCLFWLLILFNPPNHRLGADN